MVIPVLVDPLDGKFLNQFGRYEVKWMTVEWNNVKKLTLCELRFTK